MSAVLERPLSRIPYFNRPVSLVYDMSLLQMRMFKKLEEIADLPENWDGNKSPQLQPAAKETAALLLNKLGDLNMPMPHFAPVSGGGLQLEWQNNKREMELEIMCDGSISYLIVNASGETLERTLPREPFIMQQQLEALTAWFKSK